MERKYHPATRAAFLRHVVEQRGFVHTYLLMHPRVTEDQLRSICDDLYRELFQRGRRSGQVTRNG